MRARLGTTEDLCKVVVLELHAPIYRGTCLIRSPPPSWDHHRALAIGLLNGLRWVRFLLEQRPAIHSTRGAKNAFLE
jgi:hypothetical protein